MKQENLKEKLGLKRKSKDCLHRNVVPRIEASMLTMQLEVVAKNGGASTSGIIMEAWLPLTPVI